MVPRQHPPRNPWWRPCPQRQLSLRNSKTGTGQAALVSLLPSFVWTPPSEGSGQGSWVCLHQAYVTLWVPVGSTQPSGLSEPCDAPWYCKVSCLLWPCGNQTQLLALHTCEVPTANFLWQLLALTSSVELRQTQGSLKAKCKDLGCAF